MHVDLEIREDMEGIAPVGTRDVLFHERLDGRRALHGAESARPFRKLLDAADLDKDGIVTEEEMTNEIWRRADLNQDGVVTADELRYARKAGAFGPIPGAQGPSRKSQ